MPVFDNQHCTPPDHLRIIFADIHLEQVGRGELERLRALDREIRVLKDAIGEQPFEGVLIRGEALKGAFDLV